MLIKLIRNQPQGNALTGRLYVDSHRDDEGIHHYQLCMDTLENLSYSIPTGFYRLRMTHSPKFGEILPLLDHVIGRTGIRIHAGNTIEHTTGCILVGDQPCSEDASLAFGERSQANYSLGIDVYLLNSRKRLEELRNYLLYYQKQNPYEEIFIDITSLDPYPFADMPYAAAEQENPK